MKRVVVILNMRKIKAIANFIGKAKLIRKMMNGNSYFPLPPLSLNDNGTFHTDIKTLEDKQVIVLTRARGAVQTRNEAKAVVLNDMRLLQIYVQSIADTNPTEADVIVSGSGFEMKIAGSRSKSEFSAVNTKVSGTVKLSVNVKKITGGRKRASFKWQMSEDNLSWTELPTTLKGNTTVSGLEPAKYMWFRFLVVLKDGESSWSEGVRLLVR